MFLWWVRVGFLLGVTATVGGGSQDERLTYASLLAVFSYLSLLDLAQTQLAVQNKYWWVVMVALSVQAATGSRKRWGNGVASMNGDMRGEENGSARAELGVEQRYGTSRGHTK